MSWVRTTVLVGLSMVAATLPVSARSVPTFPSKPTKTGQPNAPTPKGKEVPTPPTVQAAPNTDVWEAGAGRTIPTGGGTVGAGLRNDDTGRWLAPNRPDGRFAVEVNQLPQLQEAWRSCRYAHGPPTDH